MFETLLKISRFIVYIEFLWILLAMIKPSTFFFFAKPETEWKRLKAMGVFFGALLCTFIIVLVINYIYRPEWFMDQMHNFPM
ncbi:hypothetical protein [Phascolarctobacterium sp.]|uniref:hypothetical protein n=1 Tax=Phascolarctobacterium sp. TaxID=2049039 RepID=UPI0030D9EC9A